MHITPSWVGDYCGPGSPQYFMEAARVPARLKPQTFGPWTIQRRDFSGHGLAVFQIGWNSYTLLRRVSWKTLHLMEHEIVMEDSRVELRKHLPIWMVARGRILVTGLGLGCVVRGLLANREVDHIDVVEIDKDIMRVVGHEFRGHNRVSLHHGDALTIKFPRSARWDFAWHDLWTEGDEHLQLLHAKLFHKFRKRVGRQGAWAFPRSLARMMPY